MVSEQLDDLESRLESCRQRGRAARRAVTGDTRTRAEALINDHLRSIIALDDASLVAGYDAADGEPSVAPTLSRLHASGVTVALPVIADATMTFVATAPDGPRRAGQLGINEPTEGVVVPPGELDVVLVPLVAFTASGNRCGRGKGYYDKTFGPVVAARGDTRRPLLVGVGFEVQRDERLPVQPHDVTLDVMVTELGARIFDRDIAD